MTVKKKFTVTIVDYDPNHDDQPLVTNYEFKDLEIAKAFLHWSWEDRVNDFDSEDVDEENTFHEETYAVIKRYDNWKIEWFCTGMTKVPDEFFEVAERYRM